MKKELNSVDDPAARSHPSRPSLASFPIVELRQYTLHEGQRDRLIDLFEEHFIKPQEELGMKIIGTFREIDRPDRFVWLRGFKDMDSRLAGLTQFYGGPVWQAHRDAANATMIDSDNVLLLRAPSGSASFKEASTGSPTGRHSDAVVVATIYYLKSPPEVVVRLFEAQMKADLEKAGVPVLAWLVSVQEPNNYPRLPVRERENVLLWFSRFEDRHAQARGAGVIADAQLHLSGHFARPPEVLTLVPTKRSGLR